MDLSGFPGINAIGKQLIRDQSLFDRAANGEPFHGILPGVALPDRSTIERAIAPFAEVIWTENGRSRRRRFSSAVSCSFPNRHADMHLRKKKFGGVFDIP